MEDGKHRAAPAAPLPQAGVPGQGHRPGHRHVLRAAGPRRGPGPRLLLLFCWLFAILVPLGTPLMFRYFSWIVAFAIVMILCFLPDLFCQLRYTAGRREALREYYGKMKHPGRKLAKIVLIAIALTVVNVALMFHLGFICWV